MFISESKKMIKKNPAQRDARQLSSDDFLKLGVDHVVYIKSVEIEDGVTAYAIQAADGTTIGVEASFDHAVGAVQNSDMSTVLLQ